MTPPQHATLADLPPPRRAGADSDWHDPHAGSRSEPPRPLGEGWGGGRAARPIRRAGQALSDPTDSLLHQAEGPGRRHQRTTLADKLLFPVVLAATGAVVWYAVPVIRADFTVLEARAIVRSWADGKAAWTTKRWVKAHDDTLAALQITPDNPTLHDQMGVINLVRARDAWASREMEIKFYAEAARWQRSSLALRPGHGWTWAALAESLQGLQPGSDEAWHAWRQARRYTPHEISVQDSLFRIGFAQWKRAPADVKAWMRATYAGAGPLRRQRIDGFAAQFKVEPTWQPGEG